MASSVPFVGGSYELRRKKADVQRSVNLMPTPIESGTGKAGVFLAPVPGLRVFSDLEDEPVPTGNCSNDACQVVFLCHFDAFPPVDSVGGSITTTAAHIAYTPAKFGASALTTNSPNGRPVLSATFAETPVMNGALCWEYQIGRVGGTILDIANLWQNLTTIFLSNGNFLQFQILTGQRGFGPVVIFSGFYYAQFDSDNNQLEAEYFDGYEMPEGYNHIRYSICDDTLKIWANGVLQVTHPLAVPIPTGGTADSMQFANLNDDEFMDEARLTINCPVSTEDFTPPAEAFPNP
jgi:hypothetical protein